MTASPQPHSSARQRTIRRLTPLPVLAGAALGAWILTEHTPAPPALAWALIAIAAVPTSASIVGYQLHTSDRLLPGIIKSSTRTTVFMSIAWAAMLAGAALTGWVHALFTDSSVRTSSAALATIALALTKGAHACWRAIA